MSEKITALITKEHDNARFPDLTDKQLLAIPLILSGLNDRQVSEKLGMRRETVTRWQGKAHFLAYLNRERLRLWDSSLDALLSLRTKALAVVDRALDADDLQAAFAILKTKLDFRREDYETDPDQLLKTWCMAEAEEEIVKTKIEECLAMKEKFFSGDRSFQILRLAYQKLEDRRKAEENAEPQD